MGYLIKCNNCNRDTNAINIVDLIENRTDKQFGQNGGRIICRHCGKHASIYKESNLQESGQWKRYVKGVFRIETLSPCYHPYIFLTRDEEENGEINGIHFHYYKETLQNGKPKLKHGHGPGGPPVFTKNELLNIIENLIKYDCFSLNDLEVLINNLKRSQM